MPTAKQADTITRIKKFLELHYVDTDDFQLEDGFINLDFFENLKGARINPKVASRLEVMEDICFVYNQILSIEESQNSPEFQEKLDKTSKYFEKKIVSHPFLLGALLQARSLSNDQRMLKLSDIASTAAIESALGNITDKISSAAPAIDSFLTFSPVDVLPVEINTKLGKNNSNFPDINTRDANGETPLTKALDEDGLSSVEALLRNGADPNLANADGVAPIVYCRNLAFAELLIKYGASINHPAEDGLNVLMRSIIVNKAKIFYYCLEKGADINRQDSNGNTPLQIALNLRRGKFIDTLLQAGANANIANKEGQYPINIAVKQGNKQLISQLIKYGADIGFLMPEYKDLANALIEKNDTKIDFLLQKHTETVEINKFIENKIPKELLNTHEIAAYRNDNGIFTKISFEDLAAEDCQANPPFISGIDFQADSYSRGAASFEVEIGNKTFFIKPNGGSLAALQYNLLSKIGIGVAPKPPLQVRGKIYPDSEINTGNRVLTEFIGQMNEGLPYQSIYEICNDKYSDLSREEFDLTLNRLTEETLLNAADKLMKADMLGIADLRNPRNVCPTEDGGFIIPDTDGIRIPHILPSKDFSYYEEARKFIDSDDYKVMKEEKMRFLAANSKSKDFILSYKKGFESMEEFLGQIDNVKKGIMAEKEFLEKAAKAGESEFFHDINQIREDREGILTISMEYNGKTQNYEETPFATWQTYNPILPSLDIKHPRVESIRRGSSSKEL